mgnify:CR=1 FL=1
MLFRSNRDEYLRRIDGVIYGDNPEQGIVRGTSFLHPRLRFRLEFPDGWNIQNGTTQVTAKAPGADSTMLLEVVQEPNGRTLDEVAVNQMRAAGFRAVSGERTVISGVDAYLGVYQGTLQDLGAVRIRTAHLAHGTSYYLLAGIAPMAPHLADEAHSRVQAAAGIDARDSRWTSIHQCPWPTVDQGLLKIGRAHV